MVSKLIRNVWCKLNCLNLEPAKIWWDRWARQFVLKWSSWALIGLTTGSLRPYSHAHLTRVKNIDSKIVSWKRIKKEEEERFVPFSLLRVMKVKTDTEFSLVQSLLPARVSFSVSVNFIIDWGELLCLSLYQLLFSFFIFDCF